MWISTRSLTGILVTAFVLANASAMPAQAQEKAKTAKSQAIPKVLVDNDKVQVFEIRFKPGDENTSVPRTARVARALTAGTQMRTYPDGKTEKIEWKTGDVRFVPAIVGDTPQYVTKNVGKSDLVLYVVVLK